MVFISNLDYNKKKKKINIISGVMRWRKRRRDGEMFICKEIMINETINLYMCACRNCQQIHYSVGLFPTETPNLVFHSVKFLFIPLAGCVWGGFGSLIYIQKKREKFVASSFSSYEPRKRKKKEVESRKHQQIIGVIKNAVKFK